MQLQIFFEPRPPRNAPAHNGILETLHYCKVIDNVGIWDFLKALKHYIKLISWLLIKTRLNSSSGRERHDGDELKTLMIHTRPLSCLLWDENFTSERVFPLNTTFKPTSRDLNFTFSTYSCDEMETKDKKQSLLSYSQRNSEDLQRYDVAELN